MIFFGEDALRGAIREFVTHYHEERNRQGLENQVLTAKPFILAVYWTGAKARASWRPAQLLLP
jgi:hypothetical protein